MDRGALAVSYQDPILITGCARSGTSITAGIIFFCGAWKGDTTGATKHNKKGQFENKWIRDRLVKPALREAGYDHLGQKPLPDPDQMPIDLMWKAKILNRIRAEGYRGGPWMYKGAKMCLFWPQWHFAFPKAKWIIVRREEQDIVNSCLKTGFMRAYKNEKGWLGWIATHLQRFKEMHDAGLDIVEVWPSKIIDGHFGEVKTAINHLGLEWERNIIHDFIEPRLWHKAKQKPEVSDGEYE
jgi:hypothetical protein